MLNEANEARMKRGVANYETNRERFKKHDAACRCSCKSPSPKACWQHLEFMQTSHLPVWGADC